MLSYVIKFTNRIKIPQRLTNSIGVKDDKPIEHMIVLSRVLWRNGNAIVIVSGRSDECRDETIQWLHDHIVWYHKLYMRKAGDYRPDDIVKLELLEQIKADGFAPVMAFDDRDRVVAMWRQQGIPCAQVADGAF